MNCPFCHFTNVDVARFCGRCRTSFRAHTFLFAKIRDHLFWVFRRANAGFLSGMIAWLFIPALSRVISRQSTTTLFFCLQGFLGGAFLGTVDGMAEESTPKQVRGGMMGGVGGAIGGALFGHFSDALTPAQTPWGIFGFWALAGACIGTVSALWERQAKKIIVGAVSGLLGGGVGGALGYAVYAYLIQEFDPGSWWGRRLFEGFSGGIIGVTLWFAVGLAERLVIFRRRPLEGKAHKECDYCDAHNPLSAWYCVHCGSVLQEAAAPASLHLSSYVTLDWVRWFFRFLSRLAATTGVIAGLVVFVAFLPVNPMLAFVALVLVSIVAYLALVLFSSFSEALQIYLKKAA